MFALRSRQAASRVEQRGGTVVGLLVGLVLGLAIAVVAALMITRAPVPFVNKTGSATQRLQPPKPGEPVPDPNQPLYDKNRTAPIGEAPPVAAPAPDAPPPSILERLFGRSEPAQAPPPSQPDAVKPANGGPPGAPIRPAAPPLPGQSGVSPTQPGAQAPVQPPSAPSVDQRLGAAPPSPAAPAGGDAGAPRVSEPPKAEPGVSYVLQAGAFRSRDDADAMRGKLALFGFEARIVAAEVNGQTVYRVRLGPYAQADEMNRMRARLAENGIETTVVRQR